MVTAWYGCCSAREKLYRRCCSTVRYCSCLCSFARHHTMQSPLYSCTYIYRCHMHNGARAENIHPTMASTCEIHDSVFYSNSLMICEWTANFVLSSMWLPNLLVPATGLFAVGDPTYSMRVRNTCIAMCYSWYQLTLAVSTDHIQYTKRNAPTEHWHGLTCIATATESLTF